MARKKKDRLTRIDWEQQLKDIFEMSFPSFPVFSAVPKDPVIPTIMRTGSASFPNWSSATPFWPTTAPEPREQGYFTCMSCGDIELGELPELYCERCKNDMVTEAMRETLKKAEEEALRAADMKRRLALAEQDRLARRLKYTAEVDEVRKEVNHQRHEAQVAADRRRLQRQSQKAPRPRSRNVVDARGDAR